MEISEIYRKLEVHISSHYILIRYGFNGTYATCTYAVKSSAGYTPRWNLSTNHQTLQRARYKWRDYTRWCVCYTRTWKM